MELENIVANTVLLKAREGEYRKLPRKCDWSCLNLTYFARFYRRSCTYRDDVISSRCCVDFSCNIVSNTSSGAFICNRPQSASAIVLLHCIVWQLVRVTEVKPSKTSASYIRFTRREFLKTRLQAIFAACYVFTEVGYITRAVCEERADMLRLPPF